MDKCSPYPEKQAVRVLSVRRTVGDSPGQPPLDPRRRLLALSPVGQELQHLREELLGGFSE